MANSEHLTIALSGLFQSAAMAAEFAVGMESEPLYFETMLKALLVRQPKTIGEIFEGDLANLELGLQSFLLQFRESRLNRDIAVYAMSAIILAIRLKQKPAIKAQVAERLDQIERQANYLSPFEPQVIHSFASLYSDLISPLARPILVKGDSNELSKPLVQDKIRASLLSAVRFAYLWLQVGGSRWHFLFRRKKLVETAEILLASL